MDHPSQYMLGRQKYLDSWGWVLFWDSEGGPGESVAFLFSCSLQQGPQPHLIQHMPAPHHRQGCTEPGEWCLWDLYLNDRGPEACVGATEPSGEHVADLQELLCYYNHPASLPRWPRQTWAED